MAEFIDSFSEEVFLEVMLTSSQSDIADLLEGDGVIGYYCVDGLENTEPTEDFYDIGGKKYVIIAKTDYAWSVELRFNIHYVRNPVFVAILEKHISNMGDLKLRFENGNLDYKLVYIENHGEKIYFE